MKDHEICTLINFLTKVAKEYGQTQQLRERIHGALVPLLKDGDSQFIPDWDMLEASQESLREHMVGWRKTEDELRELQSKYTIIQESLHAALLCKHKLKTETAEIQEAEIQEELKRQLKNIKGYQDSLYMFEEVLRAFPGFAASEKEAQAWYDKTNPIIGDGPDCEDGPWAKGWKDRFGHCPVCTQKLRK